MTAQHSTTRVAAAMTLMAALTVGLAAQAPAPRGVVPSAPAATPAAAGSVTPPPGYTIGPDDVLSVVFWKDKDLTGDVVVRPDGRISLPLINDVQAAGLTVEQLRASVAAAAAKYLETPVTVVVRQINSRRVFITGQVGKPGAYMLGERMTVVQLIALSGGLTDYAKRDKIIVVRDSERRADGTPVSFKVNYDDVVNGKKLAQNIALRAGDTIIVP